MEFLGELLLLGELVFLLIGGSDCDVIGIVVKMFVIWFDEDLGRTSWICLFAIV